MKHCVRKEGIMKRMPLLALTASLLVSCEKPTGPATHGPPAFDLSSSRTTFSGEATVVRATVPSLPLLSPIILGHAGPLDASGGADHSTLLSATISKEQTLGLLAVDAEVVHAATVGQGNHSRAEASVADASLNVAGNTLQADVLSSRAEARCDGAGGASASGSSEIAGLALNGQHIVVTGEPNQTVEVPGFLKVVINEQSQSVSGNQADITVNALHVTVSDPLTGQLVDVVVASSHADITCAGCSNPIGDFVTGGGWITGTPSGARANFAVAGGMKNGALWGHLSYIDHGAGGPKVKGTSVTAYRGTGTLRHIEGTADIDGASGIYAGDVADNGEPGRNDTFSLKLSNGYTASGNLAGGNIQLHGESPCP